MEKLYPILSSSDISINYVILSFVHTLEIYVDLFGGFNFKIDKDSNLEEFIKLKNSVYKQGVDFNDEYKK